jgi:hypothetical protein
MPCETHDMVLVHRVFRREFAAAPDDVRAVAGGDTDRAEVLAGHVQMLLDVLHHHHRTEDDPLWSRLRERAPEEATLRRDGRRARPAGRPDRPGLRRADDLASYGLGLGRRAPGSGVEEFTDAMVRHLDHEEQEVLPVCARLVERTSGTSSATSGATQKCVAPTLSRSLGAPRRPRSLSVRCTMLTRRPSIE